MNKWCGGSQFLKVKKCPISGTAMEAPQSKQNNFCPYAKLQTIQDCTKMNRSKEAENF